MNRPYFYLYVFFIALFCTPMNANVRKYKITKKPYRFVNTEQVQFETSRKSFSIGTNSPLETSYFDQQSYVERGNSFNSTDYTSQTPFQEVNKDFFTQNQNMQSSTPLMRASSATNDDELPGDPGQMPISDGVPLLMGMLILYLLVKLKQPMK